VGGGAGDGDVTPDVPVAGEVRGFVEEGCRSGSSTGRPSGSTTVTAPIHGSEARRVISFADQSGSHPGARIVAFSLDGSAEQ
jgi:hypothetical protein